MNIKKTVALTVTAAALLVPASVQADDFTKELKAAGAVERKAIKHYRGYDISAYCDQTSSRRFWCSYFGSKGDCFKSGKARVRLSYGRYRVRIVSSSTSCF